MLSRGINSFAITAVALCSLLLALLGGAGEATAASLSYAGVVVRHGDAQLTYAYVGFAEPEINGIELLKRTGLDVVTISFGGLGEGVCSIDEHGCPATDCRKRVCQGPKDTDPFWQYFRQTAPGDWKPIALGASSTKVHNGDVDGWSWTDKAPGLPPLTVEEVARLAGFDGSTFTGVAAGEPGAVIRRQGTAAPKSDAQSPFVYAGAGALVLIAGGVAGVIVVRRRHTARAA